MKIHFDELKVTQRYHVMTQTIIPRPIAWVLSDNGSADPHHAFNLAPFSYFNAVSSDPALVMLSIGSKPTGGLKDTRQNLRERKHCVIHIPSDDQARWVSETAETLDHGDSEVTKLGLPVVEEKGWSLPRLAVSPVAMFCQLYDYQEIGPNKQGLLFCEINEVYISDDCVTRDDKGREKILAEKIRPLARLGASEYASFGDIISHQRPK